MMSRNKINPENSFVVRKRIKQSTMGLLCRAISPSSHLFNWILLFVLTELVTRANCASIEEKATKEPETKLTLIEKSDEANVDSHRELYVYAPEFGTGKQASSTSTSLTTTKELRQNPGGQILGSWSLEDPPSDPLIGDRPNGNNTFCIGYREVRRFFHWVCRGLQLMQVPPDLEPKPMSLRLSSTGIESIGQHSLLNYKQTLRDFSIENAPHLAQIEPGTFEDLDRLRVIYIYKAPKLSSFDDALAGSHPELTTIRIQNSGLRAWPNLTRFKQEKLLSSIDLDNNRIESLGTQPIKIRTEFLNLEYNLITAINEQTFAGSEIGALSLKGNERLNEIHKNAFVRLTNLIKLDLSKTGILHMPTQGLNQLRTLIIQGTFGLKRIPSIYELPKLEYAALTYPHHCCAFMYPQVHDPSGYQDQLRLQSEVNRLCHERYTSTAQSPAQNDLKPSTVFTGNSDGFEGYFDEKQQEMPSDTSEQARVNNHFDRTGSATSSTRSTLASSDSPKSPFLGISLPGKASVRHQTNLAASDSRGNEMISELLAHNIECGEFALLERNITCSPMPNAFNPCEDIMGYKVLRVAVWLVASTAILENLSVIVVILGAHRRLTVPKFLQLNLAIADLFMGLYLAMLATADLVTGGSYFNYATDWQLGYGCKIAGATSIFASQLSIFTLSVITFERYYTITYSIDLNMRLQLGLAIRIMFVGWCYAFASAMLPILADVSSYSMTSICLPVRTSTTLDRVFLTVLLLVDSGAFGIIFACYLKMYLLIVEQKTEATAKERTVALRMALLVVTDFACWAPIIFYGATALYGKPLISMTNSKILVVFFYPLNSVANPFLYVISTRQYRRDLNYLTSRWHVWRLNLFKHSTYYCPPVILGQASPIPASNLNFLPANLGHGWGQPMLTLTEPMPARRLRSQRLCRRAGVDGFGPNGRLICTRPSGAGRYTIRHEILASNCVEGQQQQQAYPQPQQQHNSDQQQDQQQQMLTTSTESRSVSDGSKLVNVPSAVTSQICSLGQDPFGDASNKSRPEASRLKGDAASCQRHGKSKCDTSSASSRHCHRHNHRHNYRRLAAPSRCCCCHRRRQAIFQNADLKDTELVLLDRPQLELLLDRAPDTARYSNPNRELSEAAEAQTLQLDHQPCSCQASDEPMDSSVEPTRCQSCPTPPIHNHTNGPAPGSDLLGSNNRLMAIRTVDILGNLSFHEATSTSSLTNSNQREPQDRIEIVRQRRSNHVDQNLRSENVSRPVKHPDHHHYHHHHSHRHRHNYHSSNQHNHSHRHLDHRSDEARQIRMPKVSSRHNYRLSFPQASSNFSTTKYFNFDSRSCLSSTSSNSRNLESSTHRFDRKRRSQPKRRHKCGLYSGCCCCQRADTELREIQWENNRDEIRITYPESTSSEPITIPKLESILKSTSKEIPQTSGMQCSCSKDSDCLHQKRSLDLSKDAEKLKKKRVSIVDNHSD